MPYSPNKCSFRSPGGVGGGLDCVTRPRSVRGNWPLWPPGGLPWPPEASRGLMWPQRRETGKLSYKK